MALDQWTDEQEIALLKAVVRWKPVGMHKHFRMLAIRDYMIGQGVVNPDQEHTKIPGIWEKLGSLYNLPILDEREDSIMNDLPDDDGEPIELYSPFSLPEDEYGDLMFAKRLNEDGSESPKRDPSMHESTVADTDEPDCSPAPGRRATRNTRTPVRGSRVSKMQNEVDSSRRTSKATSVNEDETIEEGAEDGDGAESGEDEDEEESGEDEETNKAKRRKVTNTKGGRGRGSARRSARKK